MRVPSVARNLCTGCWECVEICPTEALVPQDIPRVVGRLCVSCGACVPACPENALLVAEPNARAFGRPSP